MIITMDPLSDLCQGIRKKFDPLLNRLTEAENAVALCCNLEKEGDANTSLNSSSIPVSDIPDLKVGAAGWLKLALLQCRTAADECLEKISEHQLCDIATYRSHGNYPLYNRGTNVPFRTAPQSSAATSAFTRHPAPFRGAPPPQPPLNGTIRPAIGRTGNTPSATFQGPYRSEPERHDGHRRTHYEQMPGEQEEQNAQEDSKCFLTTIDGFNQAADGSKDQHLRDEFESHAATEAKRRRTMAMPPAFPEYDEDIEDYMSMEDDEEEYSELATPPISQKQGARKLLNKLNMKKDKSTVTMACELETNIDPPEYLRTSRGLRRVYKEYLFSLDKTKFSREGLRTWRCAVKRDRQNPCRARVYDDLNGVVRKKVGEHTHPPMHTEIAIAKAVEKGKLLACDTEFNANDLVSGITQELNETLGEHTPNTSSLKRRLQRFRNKKLNIDPATPKTKPRPTTVQVLYADTVLESAAAIAANAAKEQAIPIVPVSEATSVQASTPFDALAGASGTTDSAAKRTDAAQVINGILSNSTAL